MIEHNVGVILRDGCNGLAPELRSFEHVSFIHGSKNPAPLLRSLEPDARHALNLFSGVAHGVEGSDGLRVSGEPARLAEIEAAEQLAHKQDVRPRHNLRPKWRAINNRL